ncbi:cytochrome P450 306a1 [Armigeres subalbatus]|uniref:cytochrome P450 306a1 n=1 Tax=Armigeres subalbatus TaxID=124917 RepID=UPI002ED489F7
MYLILAAISFLSYLLWNAVSRRGKPPGPMGLPIVGYLPFISSTKPYVTLTNLGQMYGPIFSLQMGQVDAVVLTSPDLIRDTLKREETTGRAPLFITHGIMGGHGIICAEGNLWRDQRRLSTEWLRKMGMTKFGPTRSTLEARILAGVNELLQDLKRESEKVFAFDPAPLVHHILGNLMNDIVFGLKYERDDATWQYLQHLQEEGVKHIGVSMAVNFLPFLRHLPASKRIIEFLLNGKAKTHKIYDSIIEKQRNRLVGKDAGDDDEVTDLQPDCILSNFLRETRRRESDGRPELAFCSDVQLRHLLADLFGAGVDTTFTTLRWLMLFLALDKDVQGRLRQEMASRLQGEPCLNDMDSLPYLKACVAEAQRLRTVVPLGIPHGAVSDITIGGYKVPKNSMIIPLLWSVHMDPKLWPDPERFNPDRFLDDAGQYTAPAHFMPFQTGKRMCLGDELARMILLLYTARLFWHFELAAYNPEALDLTGVCGITLTPPQFEIIFKECSLK